MFDFVFKMFSEADTAVPNLGMEEIPKLLARPLPAESIRTQSRVAKIDKQTVLLAGGSTYTAPHIIVATEATGIIRELAPVKTAHQRTTHMHFVAQEPPIKKPIIALNAAPNRLINNICTINQVAPGYAPAGQYLISLSIIGDTRLSEKQLEKAVRLELQQWFGNIASDWTHLHTRVINYALPNQSQVTDTLAENSLQLREGLYACGDFQLNGSIHAAMKAGRKVGEWVGKKL
jgi:protoporphyrinogen oxidase